MVTFWTCLPSTFFPFLFFLNDVTKPPYLWHSNHCYSRFHFCSVGIFCPLTDPVGARSALSLLPSPATTFSLAPSPTLPCYSSYDRSSAKSAFSRKWNICGWCYRTCGLKSLAHWRKKSNAEFMVHVMRAGKIPMCYLWQPQQLLLRGSWQAVRPRATTNYVTNLASEFSLL